MKTEDNALMQTVVALMLRGADIIRIGKASEYSNFTVEELQRLNEERSLTFTYDSSKDEIIIEKKG